MPRFLPTLLGLVVLSSTALPAASGENQLLGAYHAVQEAMAKDAFPRAREKAKALVAEASRWRKANGETDPRHAAVSAIAKAGEEMSGKESAADLHAAFGRLSKGVVEFMKASPALQPKWQLLFCPMASAYWTQPEGESLANPYFGKEMLTCGVKRKWSAVR